jgi:hypothetical protein
MCTPMAAIGFGLQAIGQVAGYGQSVADTKAYNSQAKQNAVNASVAASHNYELEGRRYSYDIRQMQQEGFQQAMKARQATGTAIASAGSSGLEGSGHTVNAILSDIDQQEAINEANTATKMEDRREGYTSAVQHYEAEAQGRINSMPLKSTPSPLGAILGIATAGLDATASTPTGKAYLGVS